MRPMKLFLLLGLTAISFGVCAEPVGTAFSYQGELRQLGEPANGSFDFQFELFDVETEGDPLAAPVYLPGVNVQDGIFSVELDFGQEPVSGAQLWLEISVDGTLLTPRQLITASPYAIKALSVAMGSITSDQIDPSSVQQRVYDSCSVGSMIRAINADGSVVCALDIDTVLSEAQVDSYIADNGYSTGPHTVDTTLTEQQVISYVAANDYVTMAAGDSRWGRHPVTVTNQASSSNYLGNSISTCNTHPDHQVTIDVPAAGTILLRGQAWITWNHTNGTNDQMLLFFTSQTSGCNVDNVGGWDEMWIRDVPSAYPSDTYISDTANVQRTVTVETGGTYTYYLGGYITNGYSENTERFWWANIVATWLPN